MRLSAKALLALLFSSTFALAQLNSSDAPRLFERGMNALTGVGPSHNQQAGVDDLRRSAELGFAPAQVALGYIYESGAAGVAAQPTAALDWYKKAARQDDRLGDWLAGRAYLTGVGTARDLDQAASFLRKAASQGDPFGQYLLGTVMLERNQYAEAAAWFRKAAMQGLPQAQEQLGRMLKDGRGVAADKSEAYIWLLLSARAGNTAVGPDLGALESELGTNQTDQAKSSARDLEQTVSRVVVAHGCTGWPGEFSNVPAPPPVDIQNFCR
ncbi:MAG TPA: tetratricopeptide repeat protein [Terriglobales bacterium]|jgi:hypothetical protein